MSDDHREMRSSRQLAKRPENATGKNKNCVKAVFSPCMSLAQVVRARSEPFKAVLEEVLLDFSRGLT